MCPQCRQPLIVLELRGVEVDHCLECHGIWLDAGELELLVELAGGRPGVLPAITRDVGAGEQGSRPCPRCRRKMRCVKFPGPPAVEIDRCPAGHGVWLDAGELAAIVRTHAGQDDRGVARFLGELFHDRLAGPTEAS